MIIGLISDTHIPTRANAIPNKVLEIFKETDLIIHAGDLVQFEIIKELEKLAKVVAVFGNMDSNDVRKKLPEINSVNVEGQKIGIIHNPGALWGMKEMKRIAKENGFNILVFGHTHRNFMKKDEDILFINPGSPTNPLPPFVTKPTFGLLKVAKDDIEPRIIEI